MVCEIMHEMHSQRDFHAEGWRIVEKIFHSFVISITCVSLRIGLNASAAHELRGA